MPTIKKRWKYLKKKYVSEKAERNVYVPSGSAAPKKKKKNDFELFEMMRFLDVSKPRRYLFIFLYKKKF